MTVVRLASILFAAVALLGAVPASAGQVAITFDDLPLYGRYAPPGEAERITTALLDGFRRHRWRVTGFVNEIQLAGPNGAERTALLRQWLTAGEDLGNHTYSHVSLNRVPLDVYEADVLHGQDVTNRLLKQRGEHDRWFRYPYLETGLTLDVRRKFETWLGAHGYRVAPVSMETSDWEFADAYDAALSAGDAPLAATIRHDYLAYTASAVAWYRKAATGLLGREPAFVLLLHASRLNADCGDGIAAVLRANRLVSRSLGQVMQDPAYRIPDHYAGPDGDEWVTRWALTLHKSLPYSLLPLVPKYVEQQAETTDASKAPVASSRR